MPGSSAVTPDPLDGLFRRLVENLSGLDPAALRRPVRVSEIPERLVPYRTHRAILGFDTNEDYELALLRLLAGERGYAQAFPLEAAEAFAREAASVNPDPGLYRRFPDATVLLDPERAQPVRAPGGAIAGAIPLMSVVDDASEITMDAIADEDEALAEDAGPAAPRLPDAEDGPVFVLDDSEELRAGAQPRAVTSSAPCNYCGGSLPVGRTVLFCPHCGQNIGVVHCPTCGSELDVGWGFCITCGQKLKGLG